MPLLIYRVYVADGREELVRGGRIERLTLRSIRNLLGIGDDPAVFSYMQNPAGALPALRSARRRRAGGIPSAVIAPSLLLEEVEIRGFQCEPRRLPLVRRTFQVIPLADSHTLCP